MGGILESIRSALLSIRAHKMQSFLTTLGITIGVTSVIAIVSIIQGFSSSVTDQFEGFGSNSLTITAYTSMKDAMQGRISTLKPSDLQKITDQVDGIEHITPIFAPFGGGAQVKYEGHSTFSTVSATTRTFQDVEQSYVETGRFITPSDNQSRRRVAVIGRDIQKDLELPENPLGSFISLGGDWFKVIGVMEEKGSMFGISRDNIVLIPYQTGQSMIGNANDPNFTISFSVKDINDLERVKMLTERVLRKAHGLSPTDKKDFRIQTAAQITESFESLTDGLTMILGGIVSISLVVGGIGIMNIMLVSVTERTREIGICKALGAQRKDILMQFLIEAVTLSLVGGIMGILLGYGIGAAVSLIPGFPTASVPLWSIGLALGFSAAVGIIFGIVPAAKASNLDPIDALRYE
jgi:putative ABC transport system permease protein